MADSRRTERVVVESGRDRDYDRDNYDGRPVKRISWGAIFRRRTRCALITLILLNLLLVGIGISTINPASEQNPVAGLGTGSLIVAAIINLIALFLGGYVAGKLAGTPRRFPSLMHGILTWVLSNALYLLLNNHRRRRVGQWRHEHRGFSAQRCHFRDQQRGGRST